MTVKELIEILSKADPEAIVLNIFHDPYIEPVYKVDLTPEQYVMTRGGCFISEESCFDPDRIRQSGASGPPPNVTRIKAVTIF